MNVLWRRNENYFLLLLRLTNFWPKLHRKKKNLNLKCYFCTTTPLLTEKNCYYVLLLFTIKTEKFSHILNIVCVCRLIVGQCQADSGSKIKNPWKFVLKMHNGSTILPGSSRSRRPQAMLQMAILFCILIVVKLYTSLFLWPEVGILGHESQFDYIFSRQSREKY
jgi:hypothetical protein